MPVNPAAMNYDVLKETIAETLEFLLKNPAMFFSEGDLQAIFYNRLVDCSGLGLKTEHDTGCSIGLNNKGIISAEKYKTYLIHREYGSNEKSNARADLVIFNPDDVKDIEDPINLKKREKSVSVPQWKYLIPDYIFEFGTEKSAGSVNNLKEHLENDIGKAALAKKMGFVIHIQRNYLKGPDRITNKDKHEQYAEEALIQSQRIKNNDLKVKLLYFKVDVGGEKREIYKGGKVKHASGEKLSGINQNKLSSEIITML